MCKEVAATQVMTFLNKLYTRLDSLLDIFGVYKVETIGGGATHPPVGRPANPLHR